MGDLRHIAVAPVLACVLAGCGLAQQIVGNATDTALTPVAGVTQQASYGLQSVAQNAAQVAAQARLTGQSLANSASSVAASMPPPQPVAYAAPGPDAAAAAAASTAPGLSSSQQAAITKAQQQAKDAPQPEMPVLPKDTLDAMTVDQRGLQYAAQRAALNGPVGDILSWDDSGRSGTASTESEHTLGDSLCRSWVEKVTIDGKTAEAHATACRNGDNGHWMLAF